MHSFWAVLLLLLITKSCRDGRFELLGCGCQWDHKQRLGARGHGAGSLLLAAFEVHENYLCFTVSTAGENGNWRWQVGTISLLCHSFAERLLRAKEKHGSPPKTVALLG